MWCSTKQILYFTFVCFLQSIEKWKDRQYTKLEANHKNLHFNNSGQFRIPKEILHVKQSLISSSTEFNTKMNSSSNPPLPMDGLNQFSQQKNIVSSYKIIAIWIPPTSIISRGTRGYRSSWRHQARAYETWERTTSFVGNNQLEAMPVTGQISTWIPSALRKSHTWENYYLL